MQQERARERESGSSKTNDNTAEENKILIVKLATAN